MQAVRFSLAFVLAGSLCAADLDELKVKRQEVFEFSEQPKIKRNGDRVEISFASKGSCDATVAIEDAGGKIIRHLASGVLGANAPAPFQKNSLAQTLVWDGKDDQDRYHDEKDRLAVRVSLGLKPAYEKDLFTSPKKRIGTRPQLLSAAPEGVYVYDSNGVEFLRLFDHDGNYLRTIYPFPADKLEQVQGLRWHTAPQDGRRVALRNGFYQGTLLDGGTNAINSYLYKSGAEEPCATGLAVQDKEIALAFRFLNRFATDGSSGGLPLKGPKTGFTATVNSYAVDGGGSQHIGPGSLAFSPDGKWLYLTGYQWSSSIGHGNFGSLHGVLRLAYHQDAEPAVFAGSMKEDGFGSDETHFAVPTSVACDAQGRVYVADYMNDRIQVFTPEGKLVRSLTVRKPAKVTIHTKTQELFVFSWSADRQYLKYRKSEGEEWYKIPPSITRLGTLDNPRSANPQPLPLADIAGNSFTVDPPYQVTLDPWAAEPVLWVSESRAAITKAMITAWSFKLKESGQDAWSNSGLRLLVEKDGKWIVKRDFEPEAKKEVVRLRPPSYSVQRLQVNPRTGKLYIFEVLGIQKSNLELVEVDPGSGAIRLLTLPFDAEDFCFDRDGLIYLRTDTLVARYDPATWREVPWDYGEEHAQVFFAQKGTIKSAPVLSALPTPGQRPVCWNQGGMSVSAKGHLAVSCVSRAKPVERTPGGHGFEDIKAAAVDSGGKPYAPPNYPGRIRWQEIHIWDRHGKRLHEDAVPGLHIIDGLYIDSEDSLYVMAGAARMMDGQRYHNKMASTLMKFRPGKARIVGSRTRLVDLPLGPNDHPKRPHDLESNEYEKAWVDGAEWFYGGTGFGGFNFTPDDGGYGCVCFNSRFTVDSFNRSMAPEMDHYSVAVLDGNGNLVLRIGRYGNADSAGPKSLAPLGGDEVGFVYPTFVASDTDRRVFVADPGNARIVSVRLGYHVDASIPLKSVTDQRSEAKP